MMDFNDKELGWVLALGMDGVNAVMRGLAESGINPR